MSDQHLHPENIAGGRGEMDEDPAGQPLDFGWTLLGPVTHSQLLDGSLPWTSSQKEAQMSQAAQQGED